MARWFTVLLLAALVPACSAPGGDPSVMGDEEGEAAFTADDAACFEAKPQSGESLTGARARCLTAYADRVLDRQIARREDPRDASLAQYRGKLRVAAETGCFTEDTQGGPMNLRQYDIDERSDVGTLGLQVRAAVEMLTHAHRDLDGYPNHFFDTVEICPYGQVGGDLALVGSRLRIGLPTGAFGRFGFHAAPALRDMWTRGVQFAKSPVLAPLTGARWAMLDPIGTPRTTVRRALRGVVSRFRSELDAPAAAQRDELARLILDATAPALEDDRGRNVRDRALARIASMSAQQIAAFAKTWSAQLARSESLEGAEEATVSMHDVLNKRDVKVVVSQRGLVNVNNYKQVSVDTEVFLPRASSFARYVEVAESTTNVEVEQFGLVNVQLNDVISVRLQVLYAKTLQTATLDRTLGP